MVGEPISSKLVDAFEDGNVLLEGDKVYEFRRLDKMAERNSEDDVEAMLCAAA